MLIQLMKTFTAIIEQSLPSGMFVGHVIGVEGAFSQAPTIDELKTNLVEVLEMMTEAGACEPDSQFVGLQQLSIA